MTIKNISIDQFVKQQVKKWEGQFTGKKDKDVAQIPVITVATEPGSGGSIIAARIAERLERLTGVKDFISSLLEDQYIHPDTYLRHLLVIISTIAKHGRAVIVGRGANFILPAEDIFAVRVIAPLKKRIREVALTHRAPVEQAKRRVIQRESRRKAFVRHSFNADISNPINYDPTINTGKMSIDEAVEAIIVAVRARLGDGS